MGKQVVARFYGGVAQLGEHLPCKQGVKGSNPSISTKIRSQRSWATKRSFGALSQQLDFICTCTLKTAYRKRYNIFNTKDTRHPRKNQVQQ